MSHNLTNAAYAVYAPQAYFSMNIHKRGAHQPVGPPMGSCARSQMTLTPRDEAGLKSATSLSGESGGSEWYSRAPTTAAAFTRNRFVIGIFGQPAEAYGAAKALSPDSCDVLIMLGDARAAPKAATATDGRLTIHYLDASSVPAADLPPALARFAPFSTLKQDTLNLHDRASMPSGLPQRLLQNLVRHLAAGAAVVIVHAPDPERQLQVSRTLLETKCDVLLTHDVVQTAGRAPAAPPGDCCNNCTSQACRRSEPHHHGTGRSEE